MFLLPLWVMPSGRLSTVELEPTYLDATTWKNWIEDCSGRLCEWWRKHHGQLPDWSKLTFRHQAQRVSSGTIRPWFNERGLYERPRRTTAEGKTQQSPVRVCSSTLVHGKIFLWTDETKLDLQRKQQNWGCFVMFSSGFAASGTGCVHVTRHWSVWAQSSWSKNTC